MSEIERIRSLQEYLKSTRDEKETKKSELEEMRSAIKAIEDELHSLKELQKKMDGLIAQRDSLRSELIASEKEIDSAFAFPMIDIHNVCNAINTAFGSYNVFTLGPVLEKLASKILGVSCAYVREKSEAMRSSVAYDARYTCEEAKLKGPNGITFCTFAVSKTPENSDFWYGGCLYLDTIIESKFNPNDNVQLASLDIETGDFKCNLPQDCGIVSCEFVSDFISYVSKARLAQEPDFRSSDLQQKRSLTSDELEKMANDFLSEYGSNYPAFPVVEEAHDETQHDSHPIAAEPNDRKQLSLNPIKAAVRRFINHNNR